MGIDLSGNLFRFGINQNSLQGSKNAQTKGAANIDPVVVSTSQGIDPKDVLSWMEAGAAVNRSTFSSNIATASTAKYASTSASKPTPEELLVKEAQELAKNSDLNVKVTGSKTLTKEKQCTKGRNMGVDAMNLVTKYLETDIKNQLKTQFLDKYSSVLSQLGYSTSDISEKFETMYNSTKSEIATMAKNLDSKFVTYGNKGFLKNKGWVNVDTQKLVDTFMAKFNQKAGALANQACAEAEQILSASENKSENTDPDKLNDAYSNGDIDLEEFKTKLEEMGAKDISANAGVVSYIFEGNKYSVVKISVNVGGFPGQNNGGGPLNIKVNPNAGWTNNTVGMFADHGEIGGNFKDWVDGLDFWPEAGDTFMMNGVKYHISVVRSDSYFVYYTYNGPDGHVYNVKFHN